MANITETTFWVLITRRSVDEEATCRKFRCELLAQETRRKAIAEYAAASGHCGTQEGCTRYFGACTYVCFERHDFGKEVDGDLDQGWNQPCQNLECVSWLCQTERPSYREAGIEQLVRDLGGAATWDQAAEMYDQQYIENAFYENAFYEHTAQSSAAESCC